MGFTPAESLRWRPSPPRRLERLRVRAGITHPANYKNGLGGPILDTGNDRRERRGIFRSVRNVFHLTSFVTSKPRYPLFRLRRINPHNENMAPGTEYAQCGKTIPNAVNQ